jgi:uncharacterized membrane protein YbhN (UPF0104 family)
MGVAPLFCCFNNQQPNCMAFTGLGASFLSFAFLIWGLADLDFKRKGVQAIYIISFILVILCMLAFIALLIFLNLRKTQAYQTIMNLGRIICLVILCMYGVAFIFMLVAFIIQIVDYAKLRSFLKGKEDDYDYTWANHISADFNDDGTVSIKSHEWAAIFVPSLITLICLVVMALVANILYKVFYDYMNPNTTIVNTTNNTIPTVPTVPQPGIFPNVNGPVPPVANYAPYPVTIQQSGLVINK